MNCMSVLIENKANTNTQDKEGMSALHWACSRGHLDAVKLLVEFRAFPNHMESTEDRYTPLGQFMSDVNLNWYLTNNVFFLFMAPHIFLLYFCAKRLDKKRRQPQLYNEYVIYIKHNYLSFNFP